MARLVLYVFLICAVGGCGFVADSFRTQPGQVPVMLPVREMVHGSTYTVSVRVMNGTFSPLCLLPDAANEISCLFYYGWFDGGGLLSAGPDGYRMLNQIDARQACNQAAWSIGGGSVNTDINQVVAACARALMVHRFMVDGDAFEDGE